VGAVAAADFDRSGRLSVFIGGRVQPGDYPLEPQSALLANRGGRFEDVTDTAAPELRNVGMVTSALWSDVDGDGWPDLLLTLEWGGVKYFHNRQGRGLEDWSEKAGFSSAGTGWWTSIAAADFNGDGRPDYVVGNVGLNTQYHADPAHPAWVQPRIRAGDVVLYHGFTIHELLPNLDASYRIACELRFQPLADPVCRASLLPHHHPRVPGWPELTAGWRSTSWVEAPAGLTLTAFHLPRRIDDWHAQLEIPSSRLLGEGDLT